MENKAKTRNNKSAKKTMTVAKTIRPRQFLSVPTETHNSTHVQHRKQPESQLLSKYYALYNDSYVWVAGRDANKRLWLCAVNDGNFFPISKQEEYKLHALLKDNERHAFPAQQDITIAIDNKDYSFNVPYGTVRRNALVKNKKDKTIQISPESDLVDFPTLLVNELASIYKKVSFDSSNSFISQPHLVASQGVSLMDDNANWFRQSKGITSFVKLAQRNRGDRRNTVRTENTVKTSGFTGTISSWYNNIKNYFFIKKLDKATTKLEEKFNALESNKQ